MKRKIHKIWGVGLVVVLLVSLFGLAAPASAGILGWGYESVPGTTNEVLADIDITDIAVAADGTTIWAVGKDNRLFSHRITVAWNDEDNVVVTQGISEGDRIVVSSLSYPTEGMEVRIPASETDEMTKQ